MRVLSFDRTTELCTKSSIPVPAGLLTFRWARGCGRLDPINRNLQVTLPRGPAACRAAFQF